MTHNDRQLLSTQYDKISPRPSWVWVCTSLMIICGVFPFLLCGFFLSMWEQSDWGRDAVIASSLSLTWIGYLVLA